ncbi:MAG: DUF2163 domain-containing protein [Pseudomonadota bacterium]
MKDITDELATRLNGEVTTLCLCWKLTRRDGTRLGITDHDRALDVEDLTYEPGASFAGATFSQSSGLKPGRAAAEGVLSAEAISESDLAAGLWDRASVDVYRVDWERPDLGTIAIWHGYLSEIKHSHTGAFEAELVSLKADLERPVGRVLQRRCDAVLGDTRCGIADIDGRSCDQSFETCRDVFANTENFRGFPHMPGPDFVLSGPARSGNTGGKR